MDIAAAIILVLLVLVPAVVVLALFVWAARKDGQGGQGFAGAPRDPSPQSARTLVESTPLESEGRFEGCAEDALDLLPSDLRADMSNVEIVVEEEPPPGQRLLGLYQGLSLTRRSSHYSGVLPDKITIYRGPLMRLYGHDAELLRREVRRVVLHEKAVNVRLARETMEPRQTEFKQGQ